MNKDTTIDERWVAKYPFDPVAKEYLRTVSFEIKEYFSDDLIHIVEYAYRRASGKSLNLVWDNDDIEAVSYYLSILIIRGTENRYIYYFFADRESKRAYKLLLNEKNNNVVKLSKNLGIDAKYENKLYGIPFIDYIKKASRFSDPSWKPYYNKVNNGYVYIPKGKLCRLIAETVKEKIIEDIEKITIVPKEIIKYSEKLLEDLKPILSKQEKAVKFAEDVETKDWMYYPPCIKWIIDNIPTGLPHMARFTIVTFLRKMGYTVDEIINLFSRVPDFDENRTRYQVEHIMGLRGGRKVYEVPSCTTLKSYNLCFPDEICRNIKHPLQYVLRKKRSETKRSDNS